MRRHRLGEALTTPEKVTGEVRVMVRVRSTCEVRVMVRVRSSTPSTTARRHRLGGALTTPEKVTVKLMVHMINHNVCPCASRPGFFSVYASRSCHNLVPVVIV